MPRFTTFNLTLSFLCAASTLHAEERDQIRQLIPAAAGMKKADMEKLAKAASPKAADVKDKSLTLMLLNMKISDERTDEEQAEFQFIGDGAAPKPSKLAAEMYRAARLGGLTIPLGPVTAIHANRITDFTCEIDGDKAKGTVSYRVPDLYQGKVNYIAQRKGDAWQITEFLLPAHGVHIVRGDSGWVER